MVFDLDKEGRIIGAGPGAERLGYEPGELVGRRIEGLVAPEDRRAARGFVRTALAGQATTAIVTGLCSSGQTRQWELACALVEDDSSPAACVVVIRDISLAHELTASLARSTSYVQALIEVSQAAASSLGSGSALQRALEASISGLGFDMGAVYLTDESTGSRVAAHAGMSPSFVEATSWTDDRHTLFRVIRHSGQVLVAQPGEWRDFEPLRREERLSTAVLVPAVVHHALVGRLHLYSRERREVGDDLRCLLAGIGAILGANLANARMFEDISRGAREYRRLFEGVNDAVAVFAGPEARLVNYNQAFRDLTLFPDEELHGASLSRFIHPDDLPSVMELFARRLDGEDLAPQIRVRAQRPAGDLVIVDAVTSPVFDDDGKVIGTQVALRDVTGDERLRTQERQLARAVEATAGLVMILDAEGRIAYANPASCALLEVSAEDLRGRAITDFVAATDPQDLQEALVRPPAGQVVVGELTLRTPQDNTATLNVTLSTVGGPGPDGGAAVLVGSDITRERELVAQVMQAEKLASLGQLASGVAHEFNNLIGAMSGYAQLAQATRTKPAFERLIETVLASCTRASEITRNLLSFARPREPHREPCRIDRPIDAALQLVARELDNAQVQVGRSYPPHQPTLSIDPGQLQQVFLNLFLNAIHAMPGGGQLSIEVQYAPGTDHVEVSVTDTGRGIPEADLEHIFDAFFSTKAMGAEDTAQGTGLGLSVSRAIIEAHHGAIAVQSVVGEGTTFTLRLPVLHEAPRPRKRKADDGFTPSARLAGLRVLVADDDPALRSLVADALSFAQCDVVQVGDGAQAAEALGEREFDVAVCDLLMPRADGRAVLEAVRRLPRPFPVVLMTGQESAALDEDLEALGAAMCLPKPLDLRALLDAVERLGCAQRDAGGLPDDAGPTDG